MSGRVGGSSGAAKSRLVNLTVPILMFVGGFGIGAWRAGTPGRNVVACAAALPLALLVIAAGLIGYELLRTRTGENMTDLAMIATATIGALFALVAFAGGLFGARWRRARRRL